MPRSVFIAGIATALGIAVCCALGIWQLQRMAWKNELQAAIDRRAYAEPVPIGVVNSQGGTDGTREYTRVRLRGYFDHDGELRLWSPGDEGPGWHLVTPFHDGSGTTVYVNRGYVADTRIGEADRPFGAVEITGLMRRYGNRNRFTPDNDAGSNTWYWYEFDAMREHLLENWKRRSGLNLLPVVIEADGADQGYPRGGVTRLELTNRHLEYVITWFGLAAALAGVYLAWAWQQMRSRSARNVDIETAEE